MKLTLIAETELNGKPYKNAIVVDMPENEKLINMSIMGDWTKPIRSLLLAALRTKIAEETGLRWPSDMRKAGLL